MLPSAASIFHRMMKPQQQETALNDGFLLWFDLLPSPFFQLFHLFKNTGYEIFVTFIMD